jgi:hypothetical protein
MLKIIKILFGLDKPTPTENKPTKPTVEHKTFTETGDFILADKFEKIWVDENVNDNYNATSLLNDDEYLDYNLWEDMNTERLFSKYKSDTFVISGKNPNIIFHGGCLGCASQRIHGLERCKGCKYFRANWSKPDLSISGEWSATIDGDDLKNLLK